MTNARPNILWVSFEDCNPTYPCYGDPTVRTPHLDALAEEGCLWRKAYSTAPVCSPARSAVITGMYPISIGTHHHRTNSGNNYKSLACNYQAVVPHYVKCFTEYLRGAGYYCANNSKTDYQFDAPLTAWDDCSGSGHWRNRPDSDQPFFAVFNLGRTHESGMWEKGVLDEEFAISPENVEVPPYLPDTEKVRRSIARNYTNIAYNDARLGELLAQLDEDGLAENTVVFHWSDHGPSVRGKRWPYEAGIHVPMIVRGPINREPGTVCEDLVSTIDLAPTVLSLCGVTIPWHLQGQAFLGPRTVAPREYVYISRDRYDEMYDMTRACRDSHFKYIRHYHPEYPYLRWNSYRNRHPIMQELIRCQAEETLNEIQLQMFRESRPAEELFDVDADPHELANLADSPAYAEDLARLRSALDGWIEEVGDLGAIPEETMVRNMCPDGIQPQTRPPVMVPLGPSDFGEEILPTEDTRFQGPLRVQLQSPTQGASIAWSTALNETWNLYTGPISLAAGQTTLRVRAVRIGYQDSPIVEQQFVVMAEGPVAPRTGLPPRSPASHNPGTSLARYPSTESDIPSRAVPAAHPPAPRADPASDEPAGRTTASAITHPAHRQTTPAENP